MYQLLLCLTYLRTRYIALASIVSVTLGVATMIVVNSVMSGFRAEMHRRLHGILADVVVESINLSGSPDPAGHMLEIEKVIGRGKIAGLTAVVTVPAMISIEVRGQWITRQVNVIGIDDATYASVSDFSQYLLHPANRKKLAFALREQGYDYIDKENPVDVLQRVQLKNAGWEHRRERVEFERAREAHLRALEQAGRRGPAGYFPLPGNRPGPVAPVNYEKEEGDGGQNPSPLTPGPSPLRGEGSRGEAPPPIHAPDAPVDPNAPAEETSASASGLCGPFGTHAFSGRPVEMGFDEAREQYAGVILGIGITSVRRKTPAGVEDYFIAVPGDDVKITFPTAGTPPKAVSDTFTVVDLYESKMSEYDSGFAFMPLRKLQELRGMVDPLTNQGSFTSIQIKLAPGVNATEVRDALREHFPPQQFPYRVQTWMDLQGPLLHAVQMETTILNILLFMIIAVAGFGILATFFMIVVEKTRDIGIMKSLGAPSGGVLTIFLSYGLSLGFVGAGAGAILGLLFVYFINDIAGVIEWITGQEVFDPTIYYFREIPTIVDPFTIAWIVFGALVIAVLASVLPALRAARLHPVEALRYE